MESKAQAIAGQLTWLLDHVQQHVWDLGVLLELAFPVTRLRCLSVTVLTYGYARAEWQLYT
jgi:hypothetical protein